MSGGVGPPRDMGIDNEEAQEPALIHKSALKPPIPGDFFTFRQLNALAVIIIVSASGLVRIEDLAFVIFSIIYIYFISKPAFPAPPPSSEKPPVFPKRTSQVFMEGQASAGGFSLPVRVFVPVFYNSRRIFTVVEWLRVEISKAGYGGVQIGRALAVANMFYWSLNLFGFLLPVFSRRLSK
ncbi:unnamed protein product [Fraxinus pennsylvanica]|uniref:DUF7733 domain-containing protein n=1 Tax=Fraxinus pennsylvanica TaxID=56036 RepID=A0AAD1ZF91_9LAMI|nr:unnamed protein product [Fraxinus pennsylvanica]